MRSITVYLKQGWHIFALFLICLFSALVQFAWLALDNSPPLGDGIPYVLRGMYFFQYQNAYGWPGFFRALFDFNALFPNPPTVTLTYFFYYKLFGISSNMEMMINSLYLILGVLGIYGMGRYLFDRFTGLLSAFIFTSLPAVMMYGRLGFREYHIMCILPLSLYFLFASEGFTSRRFSFLFAVSFAFMLLIKPEAFIFALFPLIVSGVRLFLDKTFLKDRRRIINFISSIGIFALIFLPWYAVNFFLFASYLSKRMNASAGINSIYFSLKNRGLYSYFIYNEFLTKFQMLFFAAALSLLCIRFLLPGRNVTPARNGFYLLVCFAFPLLIFTFLCEKDASHILSLLVFISLIMAGSLNFITNKVIKYFIVFIIVLHCIITQLIPLSVHEAGMRISPAIKLSPVDSVLFSLRGQVPFPYGRIYHINAQVWSPYIKNIIDFVSEDYKKNYAGKEKARPAVLLLANSEPLRFFQMQYYNMKAGSPVKLFFFGAEKGVLKRSFFTARYDYIIKEDPLYLQYPYHEEAFMLKSVYAFIENNKYKFQSCYQDIGRIELPRGRAAAVYRRINKRTAL